MGLSEMSSSKHNFDLLVLHIQVLSWIDPNQGQNTSPWAWHCWTPGLVIIKISAAILITGGWGALQSAELFLPWSNKTCELPSLPDKRYYHVQSGNLVCGGGYKGTKRSCIKWSDEKGGWVTLPVTLRQERESSSSWTERNDHSLVILGGWSHAAGRTSETVSSNGNGVSIQASFKMKYRTEWENSDRLYIKECTKM